MDTELFKALSDESRLRILNLLMQNELCVCEIESMLDMSQTNVSRHLNKLKNAGMISVTKKAQWAYYSIDESFIKENPYLYDHLKFVFENDISMTNDKNRLCSPNQKDASCCSQNKS